MENQAVALTIACRFCKKVYPNPRSLYKHLKTEHSSGPPVKGNHICPLCGIRSIKYEGHRDHLLFCHGQKTEGEKLKFNSFTDFLLWKNRLETKLNCKYFCQSGSKILSTKDRKYYYQCQRSAFFKSRTIGMQKIIMENSCPSMISVVESYSTKEVQVEFWSTHLGHSNENSAAPVKKSIGKKVDISSAIEAMQENIDNSNSYGGDNSAPGTDDSSTKSNSEDAPGKNLTFKNTVSKSAPTSESTIKLFSKVTANKPKKTARKQAVGISGGIKNVRESSLQSLASVACSKNIKILDNKQPISSCNQTSVADTTTSITSGTGKHKNILTPQNPIFVVNTASGLLSKSILMVNSNVPKTPGSAVTTTSANVVKESLPKPKTTGCEVIVTSNVTPIKSTSVIPVSESCPDKVSPPLPVSRTLIGNFCVRSNTPSVKRKNDANNLSQGSKTMRMSGNSKIRFQGENNKSILQSGNEVLNTVQSPISQVEKRSNSIVSTAGVSNVIGLNGSPVRQLLNISPLTTASGVASKPSIGQMIFTHIPTVSTSVSHLKSTQVRSNGPASPKVTSLLTASKLTQPVTRILTSSVIMAKPLNVAAQSLTKPSPDTVQSVKTTQSLSTSTVSMLTRPMSSILNSSVSEKGVSSATSLTPTVSHSGYSIITSSNNPKYIRTSLDSISLKPPISYTPAISIPSSEDSETILLQDSGNLYLLKPTESGDASKKSALSTISKNKLSGIASHSSNTENSHVISSAKNNDTSNTLKSNENIHADCEILRKIECYKSEMKYLAIQQECKKLKIELAKALLKNQDMLKDNPEHLESEDVQKKKSDDSNDPLESEDVQQKRCSANLNVNSESEDMQKKIHTDNLNENLEECNTIDPNVESHNEKESPVEILEARFGTEQDDLNVYSVIRTSVLRKLYTELKIANEEKDQLSKEVDSYRDHEKSCKELQNKISEEDS